MARTGLIRYAFAITLCLLLSAPAFALTALRQPSWAELDAGQRSILAPLASDWDALEVQRKKKWLGIAARFNSMSPEQQARVTERMQAWARLTPAERAVARDSFTSLNKAPPEHRSAMKETIRQNWQTYQSLPADEKEKLRRESLQKPAAAGVAPGTPAR